MSIAFPTYFRWNLKKSNMECWIWWIYCLSDHKWGKEPGWKNDRCLIEVITVQKHNFVTLFTWWNSIIFHGENIFWFSHSLILMSSGYPVINGVYTSCQSRLKESVITLKMNNHKRVSASFGFHPQIVKNQKHVCRPMLTKRLLLSFIHTGANVSLLLCFLCCSQLPVKLLVVELNLCVEDLNCVSQLISPHVK